MELIANALSKTLSSNGKLSAEPCRRSALLVVVAFRLVALSTISSEGSTPATYPVDANSATSWNADTRTEANFQDLVVRLDVEQIDYPGRAFIVHARHYDATQFSQDTLRSAKHAYENAAYNAHSFSPAADNCLLGDAPGHPYTPHQNNQLPCAWAVLLSGPGRPGFSRTDGCELHIKHPSIAIAAIPNKARQGQSSGSALGHYIS
jgi:hypothetical protein